MNFFIILLPIFGIFIVGFIAQKKLNFDIGQLSKMSLYVLSPFLSFKVFYTHALTRDYFFYIIYIFGFCIILIVFTSLCSFILKHSLKERCAMILSSCFMNNGNYGTPVILVFFGAVGFDLAVIMMVLQQIVMSTIGIYYAAKGSDYETGLTQKALLAKVIRIPVAYGAVLGIAFQLLSLPISSSMLVSVSMIGDAYVVVVMIILGMQLAKLTLKQLEIAKIVLALFIRLAISPCVAFLCVYFMPLSVMYKQIIIILAAMPTAANTTLLSVQFNTKPELVSSVTLLSTLLSLLTLPVVMWLVGAPIPF